MSKLRHMHQDVSLIILFVTKSKSQFPDFGVMGTMVGPLPILATKGLSATATELRARLILEPARRARRRQGRSALGHRNASPRRFRPCSSGSALGAPLGKRTDRSDDTRKAMVLEAEGRAHQAGWDELVKGPGPA